MITKCFIFSSMLELLSMNGKNEPGGGRKSGGGSLEEGGGERREET